VSIPSSINKSSLYSRQLSPDEWKPLIAGFLILLSSIYILYAAFLYFRDALILNHLSISIIYLVTGFFKVIGFVVGIQGSILIFKRIKFKSAYFYSILLFIFHFLPILRFLDFIEHFSMLTIFGIIFLWMSKDLFDIPKHHIEDKYNSKPTEFNKLRELKKLKDDGVITNDEFEAKKNELLETL
jgi:hypothetical protein